MNRSCGNCEHFKATQHGYGLCTYLMPPWADEDNYVKGDLSKMDWGANGCKCYSILAFKDKYV